MSLFTLIARVIDGMPLAGTQDSSVNLRDLRRQAKSIIKSMKENSPARCSIDADQYIFHYLIEDSICYLTLADRGYPKQLAYQYLEELQRAFSRDYHMMAHQFGRPYEAIAFDPQLNRIRKDFLDPRAPQNLKKLHSNLTDIHNIMQQNIQDIIERGDKMEHIQDRSQRLKDDSKKFKGTARWINIQALYKQWAPIVSIFIVFVVFIYWRYF
eukprot:147899_1